MTSTKTALVLDDCELFAETTAFMLEEMGYQVSAAYNIEDALDLCSKNEFSLALCDLRLATPKNCDKKMAHGFKALELLVKSYPKIPVIAMSGLVPDAPEEMLRETGAKSIMSKPLDMDLLLKEVQRFTA